MNIWFIYIQRWYNAGLWTAEQVQKAVGKSPFNLSQEDADEILV